MFAEELRPYILSGTFSDTDMPESIIETHILTHPQRMFTEQAQKDKSNSPSSGEAAVS